MSGAGQSPSRPFAHEAPTGWVAGVLNKAGKGHAKQFELTIEESEKRAKASGWRPRDRVEWSTWSDTDPSCYIHNALQQLGIGVGHELYPELMKEVDARKIMTQEKKSTVERLGLDKFLGRHLINVASMNDLLAIFFLNRLCLKYYARWGQTMMEKEEDRAGREKEAQRNPALRGKTTPSRRALPWHKDNGESHAETLPERLAPTTHLPGASTIAAEASSRPAGGHSASLDPHPPPSTGEPIDLTTPSRTPDPSPSLDAASSAHPTRKRTHEEDEQAGGQAAAEDSSSSSDGIVEFFRKRREEHKACRLAARAQRHQQQRQP